MATQTDSASQLAAHPTRHRLGLLSVATLLGAAGFVGLLGPLGITIAILGAAVSWWQSGLLGIVVFHAGALWSANFPPLGPIVLIELAAICLLVAEFPTLRQRSTLVGLGGATAVGAATALLLTQRYGIAIAAVTIAVSGGVLSYVVHRYEQLQLGLLGATNES